MFDYQTTLAFLRKHISGRDIIIAITLILLYFLSRIVNLENFPIFSDEGIYINWAKIAANDANWRFISLTDGKQPLQTWLTIPMFKFFAFNPLLAGRMVSVLTGFVALTGMFTILSYLFGKKTGFIGAFLYIITPYFLFYDRMALIDSGVNAGFIWILFLSIVMVRTRRFDIALIYGITAGIALLAKSSIRMFIGLSALAPVLLFTKKTKQFVNNSINYFFLLGIGGFIALVIYNIQRLSPFFAFIEQKNDTFLLSTEEFLAEPTKVIFHNIPLIPYYIFSELGYILGFLGIAGLVVLWKKDKLLATYFTLWIALPYIVIALIAEVLFPRYIIFFASSLVILAAYLLGSIKKQQIVIGCWIAVFASVAWFNYTILGNVKHIPFPPVDRGQYIMDWPAGWGMKEVVEFARKESIDPNRPVLILAEGNFGKSGDVLNTLKVPGDTFVVEGIWPLNLENAIATRAKLKDYKVYILFHRRNEFPDDWPIKKEPTLVFNYPDVCTQNIIDKLLKEKCPTPASLYLFEMTAE